MRPPLIAAILAALFVLGFVPIPAIGAALPQLALSCGAANAAAPVPCSITRLSGGQGIYVTFRTADGTAKAGIDYTAVSQVVYLKGGLTSATVNVPTLAAPGATGTLSFNAAITAGVAVVRATGSIVEPATPPPPPPPVPVPPPAPVPVDPNVGQSWCPTATSLCHTTLPTPLPAGWTTAPLVAGGYARPLGWIGCAGAIVKVEALDANAYLNLPTYTDFHGVVHDWPADRPWAVHFVNDAGGQCAATGWTVAFSAHDLEGIAPAP